MPTTPKAILKEIRNLAKTAKKPNIYSELADLFDPEKKGPLQYYALGPMALLRNAQSREDEEKAAIAFSSALNTTFSNKSQSRADIGTALESLFNAGLLHYEIIRMPSDRDKLTTLKTNNMIHEITENLWSKVSNKMRPRAGSIIDVQNDSTRAIRAAWETKKEKTVDTTPPTSTPSADAKDEADTESTTEREANTPAEIVDAVYNKYKNNFNKTASPAAYIKQFSEEFETSIPNEDIRMKYALYLTVALMAENKLTLTPSQADYFKQFSPLSEFNQVPIFAAAQNIYNDLKNKKEDKTVPPRKPRETVSYTAAEKAAIASTTVAKSRAAAEEKAKAGTINTERKKPAASIRPTTASSSASSSTGKDKKTEDKTKKTATTADTAASSSSSSRGAPSNKHASEIAKIQDLLDVHLSDWDAYYINPESEKVAKKKENNPKYNESDRLNDAGKAANEVAQQYNRLAALLIDGGSLDIAEAMLIQASLFTANAQMAFQLATEEAIKNLPIPHEMEEEEELFEQRDKFLTKVEEILKETESNIEKNITNQEFLPDQEATKADVAKIKKDISSFGSVYSFKNVSVQERIAHLEKLRKPDTKIAADKKIEFKSGPKAKENKEFMSALSGMLGKRGSPTILNTEIIKSINDIATDLDTVADHIKNNTAKKADLLNSVQSIEVKKASLDTLSPKTTLDEALKNLNPILQNQKNKLGELQSDVKYDDASSMPVKLAVDMQNLTAKIKKTETEIKTINDAIAKYDLFDGRINSAKTSITAMPDEKVIDDKKEEKEEKLEKVEKLEKAENEEKAVAEEPKKAAHPEGRPFFGDFYLPIGKAGLLNHAYNSIATPLELNIPESENKEEEEKLLVLESDESKSHIARSKDSVAEFTAGKPKRTSEWFDETEYRISILAFEDLQNIDGRLPFGTDPRAIFAEFYNKTASKWTSELRQLPDNLNPNRINTQPIFDKYLDNLANKLKSEAKQKHPKENDFADRSGKIDKRIGHFKAAMEKYVKDSGNNAPTVEGILKVLKVTYKAEVRPDLFENKNEAESNQIFEDAGLKDIAQGMVASYDKTKASREKALAGTPRGFIGWIFNNVSEPPRDMAKTLLAQILSLRAVSGSNHISISQASSKGYVEGIMLICAALNYMNPPVQVNCVDKRRGVEVKDRVLLYEINGRQAAKYKDFLEKNFPDVLERLRAEPVPAPGDKPDDQPAPPPKPDDQPAPPPPDDPKPGDKSKPDEDKSVPPNPDDKSEPDDKSVSDDKSIPVPDDKSVPVPDEKADLLNKKDLKSDEEEVELVVTRRNGPK